LALDRGTNIPKKPSSKKGGGIFKIGFVFLFLFFGIAYFSISNYFNIRKMIR